MFHRLFSTLIENVKGGIPCDTGLPPPPWGVTGRSVLWHKSGPARAAADVLHWRVHCKIDRATALQAWGTRQRDRLHLGLMLMAFSNIGNDFLASVSSHTPGRITHVVEVKKMFPTSPSPEIFRCFSSGRSKGRMIYCSLPISLTARGRAHRHVMRGGKGYLCVYLFPWCPKMSPSPSESSVISQGRVWLQNHHKQCCDSVQYAKKQLNWEDFRNY